MKNFLPLAFAATSIFAVSTFVSAQGFTKAPLKMGLASPNGIAISPTGEIYFTELPEPGKFSQKNTVSRLDSNNKQVVVVPGEPGPTNICFDKAGNFYWTCSTVGIVMVGRGTTHRSIATGLKTPMGICSDSTGRIYITQVPDPGKAMMGNNVAELVNGKANVLKMGEPEPFDIVAADDGTLYWTCRSAGVILKRTPMGAVSKVLDGLEQPSGISMDSMGRLYFSEVPTPGVFGNMGGRNKVWQYDPATKNFALISFGEPNPVDVAASKDGKSVYWTCKTAGVIFRATRNATPAPSITTMSNGKIGTTATLALNAPMQGNKAFQVATAVARGPIGFDNRFVALAPDGVFFASFFGQLPTIFQNYSGTLDASGKGSARFVIPNANCLVGLPFYSAFFVLDTNAPTGVAAVSEANRIVLSN